MLTDDSILQEHQKRIQDNFSSGRASRQLLMHFLGSGKTMSSLAAAEGGGPYSAIVPASLRPNFRKEQEKFTDLQTPSDILSYTELARGKVPDKLNTVIFDESQRLRNPQSKQTQKAIELADRAKRLLLLSATPVVNQPSDLAVPISMLTGKKITPAEFESKFVGSKSVWPGFLNWLRGVPIGQEPDVKNVDELKALLKGHVDYYKPDSTAVPVNRQDVITDMTANQTRLYKAMWDELPWLFKWKLKHDFPLSDEELRRATSFLTGPRQVSLSTLPYMKTPNPLRAFSQSGKLTKAMELLQEKLKDNRTKALIFSNFIDAGLKPYAAALEKNKIPHAIFHGGLSDIERKKLMEDYNNDRIRVALLGPSGSEGLSFKGTQLVQLLDPYWNSVRPNQSEGRGIRYDSHWHLPKELQNVEVQRFISRLPPGFKQRLLWWIGKSNPNAGKAVDDHLIAMAQQKDKLNQKFIDILKEVGSDRAMS